MNQSIVVGKVFEQHQFFAKNLNQFWMFAYVTRDIDWMPVTSQKLAARRAGAYLGQILKRPAFPGLVIATVRAILGTIRIEDVMRSVSR